MLEEHGTQELLMISNLFRPGITVIKGEIGLFHDTEINVSLKSLGIEYLLIFSGIDTSICVETSLREAFNIGYDIILISDATASSNRKHYESTLDNVRGYYGLVMGVKEFYRYLPQTQTNSIPSKSKA